MKKEREWFVERKVRGTKVGFVVASSRKEAEEKVAREEWECLDTMLHHMGKARVIGAVKSKRGESDDALA